MLELETRTGGVGWPIAAREIAYLEALDFHRDRVRPLVIAVLAGSLPFCPALQGDQIEKMDRADLLEAMGITDDVDLHAKLFAAAFDPDTRADAFGVCEDIIAAYVEKTAVALAREEL